MTVVTRAPATAAPPRVRGVEALAEVEAERAALAQVLHDDVLQTLVMARWAADRSGDTGVRDAVRAAITEATAAVWMLRPRTADGALGRALHDLADRVSPDRVVVIRADGVPGQLDVAAATLAFRVVQAALAASSGRLVDVRVELRSGVLEVSVCDDGPPYDDAVDAEDSELTRWLARAGTIGGTARVANGSRGGTTIWLQIPDALPMDSA
jgi:signal transduction histidine kinase